MRRKEEFEREKGSTRYLCRNPVRNLHFSAKVKKKNGPTRKNRAQRTGRFRKRLYREVWAHGRGNEKVGRNPRGLRKLVRGILGARFGKGLQEKGLGVRKLEGLSRKKVKST